MSYSHPFNRHTANVSDIIGIASKEARRFNHEYLGTEHLLLAIARDGASVAAHFLTSRGIDLRKIRLEIEKRCQHGPDRGGTVLIPHLPLTTRAHRVVALAADAAHNAGDRYVGSQHLLLGLTMEPDGMAAVVLAELGVTEAIVREGLDRAGEVEAQIDEYNRLKEEAIMAQDFELASGYRDKADALKREALWTKELPKKEKDATEGAEETLRRLACVLLLHLTGKQTAAETLEQVRIAVKPA